ncbi:hypothetical protein AQF52_7519 [Streptomyces venezuelae]|uniref:DUF3068 domain-containing protein n=1 Tax=Streptomyces gardneri TaxID=66892 RepID=UPI0006BC62A4|nr:DUF3068 domain-containing protein [Streptomyces gardneri]ALO13105.1 hypothetical protein AQF52_7519 [Streptomyces venezuelae]QPK49775.1 DUF3068 domain-containing protein [Streptomyces gardneri]WRK41337.1 DUF3068 domain-containing protein [Streptomyces venezuelae]CUM36223.1 FIG01123246: hypothetical protein [Streptomyces venezuelae]
MRRSISPFPLILLGTGVFLLVLTQLLAWYVEPRAKRTPTDTISTTVFEGQGSYFDTGSVSTVDDQKITITRRVVGDVAGSERSGHAIWDVSTQIDTPKTLPLADPRKSLQWTTERWVTDRRTNLPVHCCEEKPGFEGEAYLKFPFDVEKRTYSWWDSSLGATVPLKFDQVTRVDGHQGYRFVGSVEATATGTRLVPAVLVGSSQPGQVAAEEWYANARIELTVDPRTGRIMNALIAPTKTLRAPGSQKDAVTLLASEKLQFTEATRREQVKLAEADSSRLKLLGQTAPVGGGILGGLLIIVGAALTLRGGRRPQHSEE